MEKTNENKDRAMKVYFGNGWVEQLKDQIDKNKSLTDGLSDKELEIADKRNDALLNKLEKYQKTTDKGQEYFYLYPSEMKNLFKIMLENSADTRQKNLINDIQQGKETNDHDEIDITD